MITDQHERPLINIQNANIHKMQIFTKFQQLADNLFYPAVCLDELTIQTPVIPYRINSRFFVYFYLYLRSFVTVFVILCATLQGLLVRALLLELLGMYTRSVLGNCLRINCVINFDQNTAGQNIDILFLVLDVIWLDTPIKKIKKDFSIV